MNKTDNTPAALTQEPVASVWMYKDTFGEWKPFLNDQHRIDTISSGEWECTQFFATPQPAASVASGDADGFPVHELKFINRVLDNPRGAPDQDLATAKGMARSIVARWLDHNKQGKDQPAAPVAQAEPSKYGSPELQALIVARCTEKDADSRDAGQAEGGAA